VIHYWLVAARRAWKDTLSILGIRSPLANILGLVSFGIALLVLREALGREDQVGEELSWGLALLGAATLLFAAIFLSQLLAAPHRMKHDATREATELLSQREASIGELRSRLEEKLERQEIARALGRLHQEGRDILHWILENNQSHVAEWCDRKDEWRARVSAFLAEHVSPAQAATWDGDHLLAPSDFEYNGRPYGGDQGKIAHQVALLLQSLGISMAGF